MPADSVVFVVFFACVFAIAIGALAYAQSTAPKD